jgi:hypothetical protein
MFRINGLIDDFVLSGDPSDYLEFASAVESAFQRSEPVTLQTASNFRIEIAHDTGKSELLTSLQNQDDHYPSMKDWEDRSMLRIWGNVTVLRQLNLFLKGIPERGEGYSYLSEYSEEHLYHPLSPEWRLHVHSPKEGGGTNA